MTARRGRQDFFRAALDLLASEGAGSVTAARVCEVLEVTRGSFYHHFGSFDDFVEALLAEWENRDTTERLSSVGTLGAGTEDQLLLALTLDHGAEVALRHWAASHPAVAAAVHRVDALRLDGFRALLVARGLPEEAARTWADLAVGALVGLQVLEQPVDLHRLRRVLVEIGDVLAGRWPAPTTRAAQDA